MLAELLGGAGELAPLKRLISERTEGNPFFMEEIVQALFEQRVLVRNGAVILAKPLNDIRVPATVQAILASRIDRLSAGEKELLQTLAVLGREFPSSLIKSVTSKPDAELERMLSELQLGEFIYEQAAISDMEYTFKHALTQEVAYNSVLVERRRLLHERAAQSIEALYPDRLEDHLTELAHHFDRSGNVPKAVEYLSRTGARAAQQVAHSEAIGYFTRALELLRQLPDGAARDNQELDLQMALSWSLFVARGAGAPERESALVRARELGEQLGDNARLMEALLALAYYRVIRREFGLGRQLAERVLAMAEQAEAPAMLGGAHFVLGVVRFATGQFPAAHDHLERAVELFRAGPSRNLGAYLLGAAQAASNILVNALVILGYPLTALGRAHELLATARQCSDPNFIANALAHDFVHHLLLRDTRMVAERADEMLSIGTEHGTAYHLFLATFARGWATAAARRGEEGFAEMRRSISDPMFAGSLATPLLLVTLAETVAKMDARKRDSIWWPKGWLKPSRPVGE
jgi:tetratricopeptide (TPR) repeat protein